MLLFHIKKQLQTLTAGLIDHTTTPASPYYILEEKAKGQSSIPDGKANVSGSSF